MQWDDYKRLCDTPGVWSRWMLRQTLELLLWGAQSRAEYVPVAQQIEGLLAGAPLAKPSDHLGGSATDMFALKLSATQARSVLDLVRQAQRGDYRTSGTMARGLGGFEAAWVEYLAHQTTNREAFSMGTASDRVMAMIDAWNQRDLEAIVECFTDDAIYHNIPMEPVAGRDGIREAIAGFVAGASEIQWDTLHIAENADGVVLTERVDKFKMGDKWIEVPVMGTFEVTDDLISAWRDYFDLAGFQSQIE